MKGKKQEGYRGFLRKLEDRQEAKSELTGNHWLLLEIIGEKALFHRMAHCYPSLLYLQQQLWIKFGIKKCIRTIEYWLKRIAKAVGLRRTRRNPKMKNGMIKYETTLYRFNVGILDYLKRRGIDLWQFILKQGKKWKSFPEAKEVTEGLVEITDMERKRSYKAFLEAKEALAAL